MNFRTTMLLVCLFLPTLAFAKFGGVIEYEELNPNFETIPGTGLHKINFMAIIKYENRIRGLKFPIEAAGVHDATEAQIKRVLGKYFGDVEMEWVEKDDMPIITPEKVDYMENHGFEGFLRVRVAHNFSESGHDLGYTLQVTEFTRRNPAKTGLSRSRDLLFVVSSNMIREEAPRSFKTWTPTLFMLDRWFENQGEPFKTEVAREIEEMESLLSAFLNGELDTASMPTFASVAGDRFICENKFDKKLRVFRDEGERVVTVAKWKNGWRIHARPTFKLGKPCKSKPSFD